MADDAELFAGSHFEIEADKLQAFVKRFCPKVPAAVAGSRFAADNVVTDLHFDIRVLVWCVAMCEYIQAVLPWGKIEDFGFQVDTLAIVVDITVEDSPLAGNSPLAIVTCDS